MHNLQILPVRLDQIDQDPAITLAPDKEFVEHVKEHGILEPIMVAQKNNHFKVVFGQRRVLAARAAGFETIPASIIADDPPLEDLYRLAENMQRSPNPMAEAEAMRRIMARWNLTHDQLAQRLRVSRPKVTQRLQLLELEDELQDQVRTGEITFSTARILVTLPAAMQRELVERGKPVTPEVAEAMRRRVKTETIPWGALQTPELEGTPIDMAPAPPPAIWTPPSVAATPLPELPPLVMSAPPPLPVETLVPVAGAPEYLPANPPRTAAPDWTDVPVSAIIQFLERIMPSQPANRRGQFGAVIKALRELETEERSLRADLLEIAHH